MSQDLFSRYIWLVDTIRRHGRITRADLDKKWELSPFSVNGRGLPRRTFYNYRSAISELFGLTIEYDAATYEYYIASEEDHDQKSISDWMLNSAAMGTVVQSAQEASNRIFVEDVPSARVYLATVITALKEFHPIRFTYSPFSRVSSTKNNHIEPYFLKLFRQRWYVTGRNVEQDTVKTYALDRMTDVVAETTTFELPADFDPKAYVSDSFGIIFSKGRTHNIRIKADPRRAKYLDKLPLHHSQEIYNADDYSILTYRMRLTEDLVNELLSYGPSITVLGPPELRAMMTQALRDTLANYETTDPAGGPTAEAADSYPILK